MKELWIFADWNKLNAKEKKTILASKCTDVVLGFASGHKVWKRSMSNGTILKDAAWLMENGIRVHLMFWAYRQQRFLQAAVNDILDLLAICRRHNITISSLMYDAEREWHNGPMSIGSAVDFLNFNLHAKVDIPIGVTGLPDIHQAVAALLEICDYGLPQAYACWFPNNHPAVDLTKKRPHWSHSLSTEPRRIQREAHREWGRFNKPLVIGLGNYYLTRPARFGLPPMTAKQNLDACIDETAKLGYTKVAYWSLNSAHKKMIIDFFASICQTAIIITPHEIGIEPAQWLLASIGYNIGNSGPNRDGIDGDWGAKSQRALNQFRGHVGLETTGPVCLKDMLAMVDYYKKTKLSND